MLSYIEIAILVIAVITPIVIVFLSVIKFLCKKPITLKKEKIYDYLQYDLDPTQILEKIKSQKDKEDINTKVSYEHDAKVYSKYRRVQIIINVFYCIAATSFFLIAVSIMCSATIIFLAVFRIKWLEWIIAIIVSASLIVSIVSFVIFVVASGVVLITDNCLSHKFFKPYIIGKGHSQFISIKENKLPKNFESKYKALADWCNIDTYRDYMINMDMAEFLADNDICSFDLICNGGTSKKDLPYSKIKLYGLPKQMTHKFFVKFTDNKVNCEIKSSKSYTVSEIFDLKTIVVDNDEPMRLYYDFDNRIICLQIPQTHITEYKAKDLPIELSRLNLIHRI